MRTTASAASCGPSMAAASITCRSTASRRPSCRAPALVQVGSVLDVAVGIRAVRRAVLRHADIYMIDRNVAAITPLAGRVAQRRVARRRLDLLRPAVQARSASRTNVCSRSLMVAVHRPASRSACRTCYSGRAMYLQIGAMLGTMMACERAASSSSRRSASWSRRRSRVARRTRCTACAASSARCTTTTSRCRCC